MQSEIKSRSRRPDPDGMSIRTLDETRFAWERIVVWLTVNGYSVNRPMLANWSHELTHAASELNPLLLWAPRRNLIVVPDPMTADHMAMCLRDAFQLVFGQPFVLEDQ